MYGLHHVSTITSSCDLGDYTRVGLWSSIEVYVGVVCACMPGIRAFLTQVYPAGRWAKVKNSNNHVEEYLSPGTIESGGNAKEMDIRTYESGSTETTVHTTGESSTENIFRMFN